MHFASSKHPRTSSRSSLVTMACAMASITAASAASATVTTFGHGVPQATGAPDSPAIHAGVAAKCPVTTNQNLVQDLKIETTSFGTSAPVWVRLILPPGWTPTSTQKWPVLYLLTGHGASYASWSCDTFIQQYVANTGVIVVMPDGTRAYSQSNPPDDLAAGLPSFYSDWESASSDGSPEAWETFHLTELWTILVNSYHASSLRAIAGLSMGGQGSIAYAARHPGMFVAAASYSGYLHTESALGIGVENGALLLAGQDTNAPWGYAPGTPGALLFGTQWPAHDPTALVSSLLQIPLFVSVGNGTPGTLSGENDSAAVEVLEAGALSLNQDFVAALKSANGGTYPPGLTTDFYGNGTHSWAYWDAEICRSLPMLMSALHVPYASGACPTP